MTKSKALYESQPSVSVDFLRVVQFNIFWRGIARICSECQFSSTKKVPDMVNVLSVSVGILLRRNWMAKFHWCAWMLWEILGNTGRVCIEDVPTVTVDTVVKPPGYIPIPGSQKWATTQQNQQNECAPSEDSVQSDQSSLCAQWVAEGPSFLHADMRMPRLIWVFAGRTVILLVLSCRGSNIFVHQESNQEAIHWI